jgi:hypothetical protein
MHSLKILPTNSRFGPHCNDARFSGAKEPRTSIDLAIRALIGWNHHFGKEVSQAKPADFPINFKALRRFHSFIWAAEAKKRRNLTRVNGGTRLEPLYFRLPTW